MSENTVAETSELGGGPSPDTSEDDLASLLRRREHARPNRATYVLVTMLVLTVGFIGGAVAMQKFGPTSTSSTGAFPGMPSDLAGIFPTGGGMPGAVGGMTAGTVKLVDGRNIYLTTAAGETVKVIVPETASVTSEEEVDLAELASGSTVVVRGETADDGTVTATSVAEGSLPAGLPGAAAGTSATASSTSPTSTSGSIPTPSAQGEN
jgi:hypothetical protein